MSIQRDTIIEKPIFIIGHPRSGTTLLRFILSSHPRIHIPEETGFIPFLMKDPSRILTYEDTKKLLNRIGKLNYLWEDLVDDPEQFYASLPVPDLANLLDNLFKIVVDPHNAVRWGDKTPLYVQYLETINRIFPTSQVIHVIRDGRDTAISAKQKWGHDSVYMDLYYLLKNWVRNVRSGMDAANWLGPERYFEVRYEDLVTSTEYHIRRLCDFLHEKFHPQMLDHTKLAQHIGPGPDNHSEILKPVSTNSIQRWKGNLSPFERKLTNKIAGQLLEELGYEVTQEENFNAYDTAHYTYLTVKFTLTDQSRTILYKAGLLTLNRTMRKRKSRVT